MWAIWFHKGSLDAHPVHNFCHASWCPWEQAQAERTLQTYKHTNNLSSAIMDEMKPIFKDIAKTELLRKCLASYTQNAAEDLNSIIWKFCHKVKCHCVKAVNTATAIAACVFNDGATALGEILQELELTFLCL